MNPHDDNLPEELEHHLAELKQDALALGHADAEAERLARGKLGNQTSVREAVHESSPLYPVENIVRQLRFAFRTLPRHRAAIGILALGIGMSVAMFSLVDAVILRPLPFPEQDAIEVIWKSDPGTPVVEMAYPELRDIQEGVAAFEHVALLPTTLYGYGRVIQVGNAEPVQIESEPVSHDFFRVLGVTPALGRDFSASDERVGAAPVVMLSDRVWRENLSAERGIVGHMIRLNGQGHTVIGVMPPGVEFPRGCGLWVPLGVDPRFVERRGATYLQAIARLKRGQTHANAVAQLSTLFTRQAKDHPDFYTSTQRAVVTPIAEYWTGSARLHLWIMLGASLLLLGAAVISAGNLFLSRALARRKEIATRSALGAQLPQILLLFGAEGIAAGTIAAGLGLLIARATIRLLVAWAPVDIPRLNEAALHWRSFALGATAAIVVSVISSILPGWLGIRRAQSRTAGRAQSLFVFAQAAVTTMLLALATLLVLSYRSMSATDTGFANRDAVTMNLALRGPGPLTGDAFYTRLLDQLRAAPGVTSAAAVLLRPFEGTIGWDVSYEFEFDAGRNTPDPALPRANFEVVTPSYFETVGTRLLEGRDFNSHDQEDTEPVVIISASLARQIRDAGRQPLGERLRTRLGKNPPWMKVIGVAAPTRYRSVTRPGDDFYVPYLQSPIPTNYVAIRGTRPAGELATLVRQTLAGINASQAVAGVATLGELIDRDTARHRFNMVLLLWFGVCAVVLAAAGVYSVIAESVAVRSREIAIKNALGARKRRLVREIVSRAMLFALAGEIAGVYVIAAFGALGSELLYGVSPRDPILLGSVFLFLSITSLGAAFWPAWTTARSPAIALR